VRSVLVVLRDEAKPTAFPSQGSVSRLRNATVFFVKGPRYQAESRTKDGIFDQNIITSSQDLPKADCSHLIAASKYSHPTQCLKSQPPGKLPTVRMRACGSLTRQLYHHTVRENLPSKEVPPEYVRVFTSTAAFNTSRMSR
jgi:hypothetical protein